MKDDMEIKSLEKLDMDQLYKGFREAFEDYEIQLSKEELSRMLKRRGFRAALSWGAFDGSRLVSFTFNGIGTYNGRRTAYDTGTGTLPDYRGQGLAGKVFRHTEERLKAASIEQYLLEVLQHNTTAVNLYKKLGFEVSRSFNYFHQDVNLLEFKTGGDLSGKVKSMDIAEVQSFHDGDYPHSWQNNMDAIHRSPEDFLGLGYFEDNALLGYLICEPRSGDITQIVVDPDHRRKGIATTLMSRARKINQHPRMKLINTDTRDEGLVHFLEALNIPLQGKQYEMIKIL